jgi:hypothetical protein
MPFFPASGCRQSGSRIAVGTFRTTRDAKILDLTNLPRRFGFFEQQSDSSEVNRYAVDFLHSFVKSVAAKVQPPSPG